MTKLKTYLLVSTCVAVAFVLSACTGATTPLNTFQPTTGGQVIMWEAQTIEMVNIDLSTHNNQRLGVAKSMETYWTMEQAMRQSFHYGPGGCDGH